MTREPDCRDCEGSGNDYTHAGLRVDCARCAGLGVEPCLECHYKLPRHLVVTGYADTCEDGSDYQSQVCAARARELCGLIELPNPCRHCGYVPAFAGADWGHLDGQGGPYVCAHVTGERYCDSCSSLWYRVGATDTHDYDMVGDPPRYVGGPSHENCPECTQ